MIMKKYRYVLVFLSLLWGLCSCEENYHDSGLAKGDHDCTVWEFLKGNPQFDSAVVLIERAELVYLFDGKEGVTFFGFTNLSVESFLLQTTDAEGERVYRGVADIPVEFCKDLVLSHVLTQKVRKEDVDFEVKGTLKGGSLFGSAAGHELRVYRIKTDAGTVPDAGPVYMAVHGMDTGEIVGIASADITCNNGMVHSLVYSYVLTVL